jgi:hypothetical protein
VKKTNIQHVHDGGFRLQRILNEPEVPAAEGRGFFAPKRSALRRGYCMKSGVRNVFVDIAHGGIV